MERTVAICNVILDIDMGNDIDDVLALAMLNNYHHLGCCKLPGIAISKDNELSLIFTDVINTFYGNTQIQIGIVENGFTPNERTYLRPIIAARYKKGERYTRSHSEYDDAVQMLRRALSKVDDKSVALIMIGFSTNIAKLLDSDADSSSSLNGMQLVEIRT
ncbi:hypothetical protein [Poriferisphaera sp. WC338]|uniref:hypothetical protein n=1 Tax=Poriferisphaera sp. WC338 TaxID=3425129 RepID=UPI003D8195DD